MSFLAAIRLRHLADVAVAALREANRHAPRTFNLKAPHNISGVRRTLDDLPRRGGYLDAPADLPLRVVRIPPEGMQRGEVAVPLACNIDEQERAAMRAWVDRQ